MIISKLERPENGPYDLHNKINEIIGYLDRENERQKRYSAVLEKDSATGGADKTYNKDTGEECNCNSPGGATNWETGEKYRATCLKHDFPKNEEELEKIGNLLWRYHRIQNIRMGATLEELKRLDLQVEQIINSLCLK